MALTKAEVLNTGSKATKKIHFVGNKITDSASYLYRRQPKIGSLKYILNKEHITNMFKALCIVSHGLLILLASAVVSSTAQGQTLWDESMSGDLSNNQAAPSTFSLASGANNVIGTVGGGDTQDWITLTVPAGLQLSSLTLASYVSADVQGFTGVQAGTAFVGSVNDPAAYLGYAHFGTAADNGSLPTANLVGVDILPIMGNPSAAPGSQGFTPPLGSGSYVFLIQQLGSATSYQFGYGVTPVPEVRSQAIVAILCGVCVLLKRRFAKAT
jgi:hypothetical protein